MGHFVFAGVELQNRDFGERIRGDEFRNEMATIVEHDGHLIGVEDVARHGQNVAFAGNQHAALVVDQAARAAGTVDLYDFGLHFASDID